MVQKDALCASVANAARFARTGAPIAAVLIPAARFLSVTSPTVAQPNGLINFAYIGALFLAAAVLSLGVGLIRAARSMGR